MDKIHRRVIDRVKGWAEHHPRVFWPALIAFGFFLTLLITFVFLLFSDNRVTAPDNIVIKKYVPPVYYSPLSGLNVEKESDTKKAVTGIMIENSPDARPQSGLKKAGVVFEAIAEGGITRFLALYQNEKPKGVIGPVRSVRMYYVNWIQPFNASVAHIGGSYLALKKVRNGKFRDIDQFFNADYYWRATDRYAPHNVYTNFAKLNALNKKKGYTKSTFESWTRADVEPLDKPKARIINISISGPLYDVQYRYVKKGSYYKRYEGGAAHLDREEGQIAPKVVIVMDVIEKRVFEDGWRESITTTGSGRVRIFQGGDVITGKWVKPKASSQLKFVDKKGKEIELGRGQTWITAVAVNEGKGVKWTK